MRRMAAERCHQHQVRLTTVRNHGILDATNATSRVFAHCGEHHLGTGYSPCAGVNQGP